MKKYVIFNLYIGLVGQSNEGDRMGRACSTCGEMKNGYKILPRNSEERISFEMCRRRWGR
jgi:hypothetical protein